jgi:hypothetical protein
MQPTYRQLPKYKYTHSERQQIAQAKFAREF